MRFLLLERKMERGFQPFRKIGRGLTRHITDQIMWQLRVAPPRILVAVDHPSRYHHRRSAHVHLGCLAIGSLLILEGHQNIADYKMSSFTGFSNLAPKTKNLVVAGGLTSFVVGVYYYTMRAVGGTDELQVAIDKFEEMHKEPEAATTASPRS